MSLLGVATFTFPNLKIYCTGTERGIQEVKCYIKKRERGLVLADLYNFMVDKSTYMHFTADSSTEDETLILEYNNKAKADGLYITEEEWADAYHCSDIKMPSL